MRRSGAFLVVLVMGVLGASSAALGQSIASADAASARGDYIKAARILGALAARGDSNAEVRLGYMYANGFGVPQSHVAAAEFYQRAAQRGHPTAQYLLGTAYDVGRGVERDDVLSYMWLNLATAGASPRERDHYARIRDAIASKMTQNELATGQYLATGWAASRAR
jgi:uncharacterized protein